MPSSTKFAALAAFCIFATSVSAAPVGPDALAGLPIVGGLLGKAPHPPRGSPLDALSALPKPPVPRGVDFLNLPVKVSNGDQPPIVDTVDNTDVPDTLREEQHNHIQGVPSIMSRQGAPPPPPPPPSEGLELPMDVLKGEKFDLVNLGTRDLGAPPPPPPQRVSVPLGSLKGKNADVATFHSRQMGAPPPPQPEHVSVPLGSLKGKNADVATFHSRQMPSLVQALPMSAPRSRGELDVPAGAVGGTNSRFATFESRADGPPAPPPEEKADIDIPSFNNVGFSFADLHTKRDVVSQALFSSDGQ